MLGINVSKTVTLGTIITAIVLSVSVLFFVVLPTYAQSGGEKSKSAWNVTQGRDAEDVVARPGDVIDYTLEFRNTDSSLRTVRIEDNISDVLKLAVVQDRGGAELRDSVLRWPSIELARNERTTQRFSVRVLTVSRNTSDTTMSNTFGNTVRVRVRDAGRVDGVDVTKSKSAHNVTRGQNAENVTARPGDIIEYRLQVRNRDTFGSEITIEDDIRDLNDLSDLLSVSDNGERAGDTLRWRNVNVGSGQAVVRTFRVRIKEQRYLDLTSDRNMTNTFGNTVEVRIRAEGGSSAARSVSAFNTSQNRNAEGNDARAGDIITFTLVYRNNSNSTERVTIESDIADVLHLSEITNHGGGNLSGSVIRFDNVPVSANSRAERSFQVRVRSIPPNTVDNVMSMNFGNGVDVYVLRQGTTPAKGQVTGVSTPFKAPETGTSKNVALLFAGVITAGLYIRNRRVYRTVLP